MTRIDLNDGLRTSHTDIDHDHRILIDLINQLHSALESGQDKDVCGKIISELINYAVTHFSMEERLMEIHRYSNVAAHKAQHAMFLKEMLDFKAEFELEWGRVAPMLHKFLGNWLVQHILHFDLELAAEIFKLAPKKPHDLSNKIATNIIRSKLGDK